MMLSKLFFKKRPKEAHPAQAELRVVPHPHVCRLHGRAKEHVNNLGDRIDEVINDFNNEVAGRGGFVTRAEVVGTLAFLQHDYLTGKR